MAHLGLSHRRTKGVTGLVTFFLRGASKTRCLKEVKGKDKSEGKKRKKTYAASG